LKIGVSKFDKRVKGSTETATVVYLDSRGKKLEEGRSEKCRKNTELFLTLRNNLETLYNQRLNRLHVNPHVEETSTRRSLSPERQGDSNSILHRRNIDGQSELVKFCVAPSASARDPLKGCVLTLRRT